MTVKDNDNFLLVHIAWIFCFLLIFISSFFLNGKYAPQITPEFILDDSWQVILENAFEHNFQFGKDIIFTYGPLGFLGAEASLGHLIFYRITFALLLAGVTAWTITGFARRIPTPIRYLFLLWFFFAGYNEEHGLLIMAYIALILADDLKKHTIESVFLIFFIAILSLIKFTFILAAAFTIIVCLAYKIAKRKITEAVLTGVWFCCSILILWTLSNQEIGNIGPWLKGSFEIVNGYTDAMAIMPDTKVIFISLLTGIFFIAGFSLISIKSKSKSKGNLIFIMLVMFYLFLTWKHSFVRTDNHVFYFFNFFPSAFALLFIDNIWTDLKKNIRYSLTGLYIVIIGLCITAISVQHSDILYLKFFKWPSRISNNLYRIVKGVTGDGEQVFYALDLNRKWEEKFNLSFAEKIIGKEPVDVFNFKQWPAIAAGLNYSPRPVIHGYSAYTSYLQDLNLWFLRNKKNSYILLNMETIDHRFPTLDDATAIPYIFNNYLPVGKDENFLILKRIDGDNNYSLQLVHEQVLGFSEKLDLSLWNKMPIFLQVIVKPSIAERLQNILFQPFPLYIVTNSKNGVSRYRFIPRMAERGFLLSPIIKTNNDLIDFMARGSQNRVESIYFEADYNYWHRSDVLNVKVFRAENFPARLNGIYN